MENIIILQIGSGPWQTKSEIGSGSSILHENLHQYLYENVTKRTYSFYLAKSNHQRPAGNNIFFSEAEIPNKKGELQPFPCVYDPLNNSDAIYYEANEHDRNKCLLEIEHEIYKILKIINLKEGVYPDLIYIHHGSFNALATINTINKQTGLNIPICIHLHGTDLKAVNKYKGIAHRDFRKIISYATRVICISASDKQKIVEILPEINHDKITMLTPWLNHNIFFPQKEYDSGGIKIAIISRLAKWKRIDALILSAKELQKLWPNSSVDIIGEGPDKYRLEKLSLSFGLEQKINFLGFMGHQQVSNYLRNTASITVNSSSNEPFGLTIIESLACGVPVISTNSGGPKDIHKPELLPNQDLESDIIFSSIGALVKDSENLGVFSKRLAIAIQCALQENWRVNKSTRCALVGRTYSIHSKASDIQKIISETMSKQILQVQGIANRFRG